MIDIDDLWIGDKLRLLKSGRIGTYEGSKEGKLIVKVGDKRVKTSIKNVEIYVEPRTRPVLDLDADMHTFTTKTQASNSVILSSLDREIDLHIRVLAPHLQNENPIRILDYQIEAFEHYIDLAYSKKYNTVKIIHGKGEGRLRTEVRSRLEADRRVKFKVPIHRDGATEVWFDYSNRAT